MNTKPQPLNPKSACAGPVVLGRTSEELLELAAEDGQPAYRAKQLMDGILRGARSIDDIGNVRRRTACAADLGGVPKYCLLKASGLALCGRKPHALFGTSTCTEGKASVGSRSEAQQLPM